MTLKPRLAYHFYHILWSSLDLVFPPSCGGCGKQGVRWCDACQQKLSLVPQPVCEVCGQPQRSVGICKACTSTRPAFYALRSCVVYNEPARPALIKLKYHRELGLGEALSWNVAHYLDELGWQADSILPIPLSEQRFAERGYNQVDLIAHPLARLVGWKYVPGALHRTRHTSSQVGLGAGERRKNVLGAFQAESRLVAGKTMLLIDDVATTGATIDSASRALVDAGASKVYALTFARAMNNYGSDYVKSLSSHPSR